MKAIIVLALVGISAMTVPDCALAATELSNLQQSYSASFGVGNGSEDAVQFVTGSLSPVWQLDSVTLSFGGPVQWGARDNGPILYSAYISDDIDNTPASQLASLGSFDFTNQTANTLQVTLTPSTAVAMNPDSPYWVVVSAITTCPNGILAGTGRRQNDISGTGWQYGMFGVIFSDGTFTGSPSSATPFLEIQASPESVPEPSIVAFMLAVIGTVFFNRYRAITRFGANIQGKGYHAA